jgi:hypothetical protein
MHNNNETVRRRPSPTPFHNASKVYKGRLSYQAGKYRITISLAPTPPIYIIT